MKYHIFYSEGQEKKGREAGAGVGAGYHACRGMKLETDTDTDCVRVRVGLFRCAVVTPAYNDPPRSSTTFRLPSSVDSRWVVMAAFSALKSRAL